MPSDSHAILTSEQAALLAALLQPLERADRAIGREPGPFRFETNSGYRDLSREDLSNAAQVYRTLQSAALASTAGAGAGDWVTVPREPTEEMRRAFEFAFWRKADDVASPTPTEFYEDGGGPFGYGYSAMIEAAPAVPASPRTGAGEIAQALQAADWSGVSIGNKALIAAAIHALSQGGGAGRSEKGEGEDGLGDGRRICEALGFDPINHHNALKCPYCNPNGWVLRPSAPAQSPSTSDAEG